MTEKWEIETGCTSKVVIALIFTTWLITLISFPLICCSINSCHYDQEALLTELDKRFVQQHTQIKQTTARATAQKELCVVDDLLARNQLVEAKFALQELAVNEYVTVDTRRQATTILKQMERNQCRKQ